jgi:hypothetical protein
VITASQDELFPSLAARTVEPSIREQYNRFRKDFDRLGGILPPSVAATFLGVSKQRVDQLIKSKQVRSVRSLDRTWVSMADVLERTQAPVDKGGRPKKTS